MFFSRGVDAIPVKSKSEVEKGPPGAFFIAADRSAFYLRCPCGRCDKWNTLNLDPGRGGYTWSLSGTAEKPTLSPSIHWMEKDGMRTHWHGWLRDGVFEG